MPDIKIINSELLRMKELANADISGFCVGCVLEDIFGRFYYGSNSEYEDRRAGLCAESAAIADMSSKVGATMIKNIYLSGASKKNPDEKTPVLPCGLCRQRLAEICDENTNLFSLNSNGDILKQCKFFDLYPFPFTLGNSAEFLKFITSKRENNAIEKYQTIEEKLHILYDLSFPVSGKREACIIELSDGNLITGNYFGTSCYKADIDAKTAAYSKIAQKNLWAGIKHIHFLG